MSVGLKDGNDTLYLYSHWGGFEMFAQLANALKVVIDNGRLNDPAYATRIVVSQIIGDGWNSPLGYGLSDNQVYDVEHSVPVVNWTDGTVSLYNNVYPFVQDNPKFTMGIQAFVDKYAKALTYA